MKLLHNLKHTVFVGILSLLLTAGFVYVFGGAMLLNLRHYFIYHQGVGNTKILHDYVYPYHFKPSQDIALILIDEDTINFYQSGGTTGNRMLAIRKNVYADLFDRLTRNGVNGIGVDIVFSNPDEFDSAFAKEFLVKHPEIVLSVSGDGCIPKAYQYLAKMDRNIICAIGEKNEENEEGFRSLITQSDVYYFNARKHDGIVSESGALSAGETVRNPELGYYVKESTGGILKKECNITSEYSVCPGLPNSNYYQSGITWGLVNMSPKGDRRLLGLTFTHIPYGSGGVIGDGEVLTLPYALYRAIGNPPLRGIPVIRESKGSSSYVLTPFFGGNNIYPTYSFKNVARDMSDAQISKNFRGKVVFIGENGNLFHDQVESPVTGDLIPGVETHAHTLDGFLQKRFLREYSFLDIEYLVFGIVLVFFMSFLYISARNIFTPFLALGAFFLTWFVGRYVYFNYALVIEIFPLMLASSLFTYPVTYIYKYFIIDREKNYLTSAFAHYIDPKVVKKIGDNAGKIELGGETRDLTILFSDIAGFTTLSESMSPNELFELMSEYLSRMTDVLIAEGGTLDKYIGDAVMGFFGAPLAQEDHATRGVRTALGMRKLLPAFNDELSKRGLSPIDFRVGMASGEVLVGNVGSTNRFNYTVLGDVVNLASRLEATSKEYGTHIIISDGTYQKLGGAFYCRRLDKIAVKGKTEGVLIYEVLAEASDSSLAREKYEVYEKALDMYFAGKYEEAATLFEQNSSRDVTSGILANRCHAILRGELHVENGVYVMTHK